MARFFDAAEIDPQIVRDRRLAIVGYGNQGHAHALNLRDSGVEVTVALHEGSRRRERAETAGFRVVSAPEAARECDALMLCTPDLPMGRIYTEEIAPYLRDGMALLFAHGFAVRYGLVEAPPDVDVVLVAPKGAGVKLRSEYVAGRGLAALIAVGQDATGKALDLALSYAWGIGSARSLLMETTFAEETETDLFGEQAVLCGGIPALIKAAFDTLVDAGYQPEAAYFECLHEAKLITDLMFERGLAGMRSAISDTAAYGGLSAGSALAGPEMREAMRGILSRIRSGAFAEEWLQEDHEGRPRMRALLDAERSHGTEVVGRPLRERMGMAYGG